MAQLNRYIHSPRFTKHHNCFNSNKIIAGDVVNAERVYNILSSFTAFIFYIIIVVCTIIMCSALQQNFCIPVCAFVHCVNQNFACTSKSLLSCVLLYFMYFFLEGRREGCTGNYYVLYMAKVHKNDCSKIKIKQFRQMIVEVICSVNNIIFQLTLYHIEQHTTI